MTHASVPQMAGRGLVVKDQRLLLVRGDGDGTFWTLPGGRAGMGEDAKSCVRREVYEETGIHVTVKSLFAASEFYDPSIGFHIVQLIFFCEMEGGNLQEGWVDWGGPVQEAKFFTLQEVRALPRVAPAFLIEGRWQDPPSDIDMYRGMERSEARWSGA